MTARRETSFDEGRSRDGYPRDVATANPVGEREPFDRFGTASGG